LSSYEDRWPQPSDFEKLRQDRLRASRDLATVAATKLLDAVFRFHGVGPWRIHLSVITESRKAPPIIHYDWKRANMFGVSFTRRDRAKAETWAVDAIRAGFCPFYHHRKAGSGTCPNEVMTLLGARHGRVPRAKPEKVARVKREKSECKTMRKAQ
jgi:hypothetical protein